jgi:polyhydroxybutyrate depolymerase
LFKQKKELRFMNWHLLTTLMVIGVMASSSLALCNKAIAKSPAHHRQESGIEDFYLPVQQKSRHVSVYTPSRAQQITTPMPAVFIFHGYGMDDRDMMQMTRFNALAEKEGFLAVYPQGRGKMWNSKGVPNDLTEDVDFVEAILLQLAQSRNVDSQRIYATGLSNGGLFVQRLACEMPGRFAAFATVAATIGKPQSETCTQAVAAPVLMIHGTNDPIITWNGKIHRLFFKFRTSRLLSVQDTLNLWLERNGCEPNPSRVFRAGISQQTFSQQALSAEEREFRHCKHAMPVTQLIIHGGGHTWPGNTPGNWLTEWYMGKTYRSLDASAFIWNFFQASVK